MANQKSKLYKILKANELLDRYTNEGDVINDDGKVSWYNIPMQIAYFGIRKAQRSLFRDVWKYHGIRASDSFNPTRDTHSVIKFRNSTIREHMKKNTVFALKVDKIIQEDPWSKIFSVEPPRATLVNNANYSLKNIKVYRYTKKKITSKDVSIMLDGLVPILGTKYDFGQLVAILTTQIAGYPFVNDKKFDFLDLGAKRKVCSVSVASVYTYWRHILEKKGTKLPRLFSKLNDGFWDQKFINEFEKVGNKWPVERTYPANFSVTNSHFDNEFELVLHMKGGKILYKQLITV